jgi:hypothetical protein
MSWRMVALDLSKLETHTNSADKRTGSESLAGDLYQLLWLVPGVESSHPFRRPIIILNSFVFQIKFNIILHKLHSATEIAIDFTSGNRYESNLTTHLC